MLDDLRQKISDWAYIERYSHGWLSQSELADGLMPARDKFLKKCTPNERFHARGLLDQMDSLKSISDFTQFLDAAKSFGKIASVVETRHKNDAYRPGEMDAYNIEFDRNKIGFSSSLDTSYALQGGNIWRYFVNPFSTFSLYAEMQWAMYVALDCLLTEVLYDGYSLNFKGKHTAAYEAEVKQVLEQYLIPQHRLTILKHYAVYGNALLLPHYSLFPRHITRFEPLVMDRTFPVFDAQTESLRGWDYWLGPSSTVYKKEELLHLCRPSLRYPEIGLPPAAPLAVDLETDIGISNMNLMYLQKGCMLGLVIALKAPPDGDMGTSRTDKLIQRIQADIRNIHSGQKGAQSVLVNNYIDDVFNLSRYGESEGAMRLFRETLARSVAAVYKVPVERLNTNFKSQGVYEAAAVHNGSNETLDKSIHSWITPVDEFINTKVLPMIGLDDVEIVARGRYGNLGLNGAKAAYIATQCGGLFTKNQMLMYFFGMPPVADESGNKIMDNSTMRDPALLPTIMGEPDPNLPSPDQNIVPESQDDEDSAPPPQPKSPKSSGQKKRKK